MGTASCSALGAPLRRAGQLGAWLVAGRDGKGVSQQGGRPGGSCGVVGSVAVGLTGVRMHKASGGKATLVQKRPSSS